VQEDDPHRARLVALAVVVVRSADGEQTYTKKYRKPVWPKGHSGVTIGIGYDAGNASKPQLRADWGHADAMITAPSALG
jgi:hypothetical protein